MATTFRFGGVIGSGGFGVVKHAEFADPADPRNTGQRLAAKFLAEGWLDDEEALHRFEREVRLRLSSQRLNK